MKVVIISNCAELIRAHVEEAGHVVVHESDQIGFLLASLARYSPNVVLLESNQLTTDTINRIAPIFRHIRFVALPLDDESDWTTIIPEALSLPPLHPPLERPPEKRLMIFDSHYDTFNRAKSPTREQVDEKKLISEEARLMWMLRQARHVDEQAKRYSDALRTFETAEWQDIAFRLLHGRTECIAFTRQLCGGYLGLLAHYLPGIDPCGLPNAVELPPQIRYVHYDSTAEFEYCLRCLSIHGIDSLFESSLDLVAGWRYQELQPRELIQSCIYFCGVVFNLRMIAISQRAAIAHLLNSRNDSPKPDRKMREALQTFAAFWSFKSLFRHPSRVRAIVDTVTSEPLTVIPPEQQMPTFQHFLQSIEQPNI
jgi:hypothetical protein